jgi:tRNA (guanine37-N1)-methyltransferase
MICGHYEGIVERVLQEIVTDEISIGNYILTGGELAAMVLIDSISRLVPGVLSPDSSEYETFSDNLLEYPQYTRPQSFHGINVPEVLLSGHHEKIRKWRHEQSLLRTYYKRPDLLITKELSEEDKEFLKNIALLKKPI